MNSKIFVTGTLTQVNVRQYVKDNQPKELIVVSLAYASKKVKDATGQETTEYKYVTASLNKTTYIASLVKGDNVTIWGTPDVETYTKQDGSLGVNFRILNAELTVNVKADRIKPYEAKTVAATTTPPQAPATPYTGYNPQYGAPMPQTPTTPYAGYNPQYGAPMPQTPTTPQPQVAPGQPQQPYYGNPASANPGGFAMPNVSDDDLPF